MLNSLLLSMPGGSEIFLLILVPILVILILMAIRKPLMWYYGIIDLILESRKQTQLLEEIRDELRSAKATSDNK
ncbi:MAG: hypothetical protein ACTHMM_05660 [Agriterribacter sp.]